MIVCAWQAVAMNTIIYISGLQTVILITFTTIVVTTASFMVNIYELPTLASENKSI